jgi:hypothetical protein
MFRIFGLQCVSPYVAETVKVHICCTLDEKVCKDNHGNQILCIVQCWESFASYLTNSLQLIAMWLGLS